MQHIVLSDIHGNREALTAVLDAGERLGIDSYVCLGDVVGYGPQPNEAIEVVLDRNMLTVKGNHDQAAIDPGQDLMLNSWAREAIRWTRERLSDTSVRFLNDLPPSDTFQDARLVHATPSDPEAWHYILGAPAAAAEFAAFDEPVCFIGHSHVPLVIELTERGPRELEDHDIEFAAGSRYLINVGSVGQPRDGDRRAAFGVVDFERGTFRLARVEYDACRTRNEIIDAGLPPFLGDRLLRGE